MLAFTHLEVNVYKCELERSRHHQFTDSNNL